MLLSYFLLCVLALGVPTRASEDQDAEESVFVQSVRPRTIQSLVEEEVQRVRKVKSQVFPPTKDKSYWVPYSDRTVLALSFPVLTHDIFTPVLLKEPHHPPPPLLLQPKPSTLKLKKPKSDLGVVISRNSVLRENFRDYGNMSRFPEDMKPSDALLVEVAQAFSRSQKGRRTIHSLKTNPEGLPNFVMVALETRVKYPKASDAKHFGTFGNAEILRNGTISFPSSKFQSLLVHVPFYFRSAHDIEHIFDGYESESGHLVPQERTEITAFLKLVYGLHEDTFAEGDEAVQRMLKRSRSLKRPKFSYPVENEATNATVEEKLLEESLNRDVAWLYTNSVAMRVLSSPIYLQHLVPVVPVLEKQPIPVPVILKEHPPAVPVIEKHHHHEEPLPSVPLVIEKPIHKEVPQVLHTNQIEVQQSVSLPFPGGAVPQGHHPPLQLVQGTDPQYTTYFFHRHGVPPPASPQLLHVPTQ